MEVLSTFKAALKEPYWVVALLLGGAFVFLATVSVDKNSHWTAHEPVSLTLVGFGATLMVLSVAAFVLQFLGVRPSGPSPSADTGLDMSRVTDTGGVLTTRVESCEVRILFGRIEDQAPAPDALVVLPCNEYFDDRCVEDNKSALGAFVNRMFDGRAPEFVALMKEHCRQKLGPGENQRKTKDEVATSFGPGRSLLLIQPLGSSISVALVSTTTQRAGVGLTGQISYLFSGIRDLVTRLADTRLTELVMPVMGAGHGRISSPLALVGLLLAVADAVRSGQGGQRLKRVTIVVFRRDGLATPEVDPVVARRALALVGA
jgi:hypothetical protein